MSLVNTSLTFCEVIGLFFNLTLLHLSMREMDNKSTTSVFQYEVKLLLSRPLEVRIP